MAYGTKDAPQEFHFWSHGILLGRVWKQPATHTREQWALNFGWGGKELKGVGVRDSRAHAMKTVQDETLLFRVLLAEVDQ